MSTRTGIANLPLHGGKAPRWLFDRMSKLAREMLLVIRKDYSEEEILRRLSRSLPSHSSGTIAGPSKEISRRSGKNLSLF